MSARACRCGALVEVPLAHEWGSWVQCGACRAFVSTLPGQSAPILSPAAAGAPPGWAPTLPLKPASRIEFGLRRPSVRVYLTVCPTCRAWLPIDRHATPRFVRCGGCGARRSLEGQRLDAQVFVLFRDSGALYAERPERGLDEERISMPTRAAPTRAWVERETGDWLVAPLLEREVELRTLGLGVGGRARLDDGWFLIDGTSHLPLASGEALAPGVWFGQSGACEPQEHFAPLDERPGDPSAWEIWADHLEERDEGGAASWLHAKTRSDMALADQLGFLAPLARRGLVSTAWNRFGYVERLVIGGDLLRRHPFVLDARFVPAVRYLQTLRLELEEPAVLARLVPVLSRAVFPRALRRLELSGSSGDVSQFELVISHVRAQCPWFGR